MVLFPEILLSVNKYNDKLIVIYGQHYVKMTVNFAKLSGYQQCHDGVIICDSAQQLRLSLSLIRTFWRTLSAAKIHSGVR